MNASLLDLCQRRFGHAFRGFNRIRVASFIAEIADDYQQALRDTDNLRRDLARMEAVLNEHREREKDLRTTLMAAHLVIADIKAQADLEAERITREAEGRSDLLVEQTQARLDDVQCEIDALKLKRKDVETTVEVIIQGLRKTIAHIHSQDAHEREDTHLGTRGRTPRGMGHDDGVVDDAAAYLHTPLPSVDRRDLECPDRRSAFRCGRRRSDMPFAAASAPSGL